MLLLRVLARSLVLWDSVQPTSAWIEEQVPPFLAASFARLGNAEEGREEEEEGEAVVDWQSVRQSHAFILAGACFALGLRFASTEDKSAAASIKAVLHHFRRLRETYPGGGRDGGSDAVAMAQRPERSILEMCLGTAGVSLGLVMAGSGDLDSFRFLRQLRRRVDSEVSEGGRRGVREGGREGRRERPGECFRLVGVLTLGLPVPRTLPPSFPPSFRPFLSSLGDVRKPYGIAYGYRLPFPRRRSSRALSLGYGDCCSGGCALSPPTCAHQRQSVLASGRNGGREGGEEGWWKEDGGEEGREADKVKKYVSRCP